MNPDDFIDYQWEGLRFVHKPRGRECHWTVTPMQFENLRTVLLVAAIHEKGCGK